MKNFILERLGAQKSLKICLRISFFLVIFLLLESGLANSTNMNAVGNKKTHEKWHTPSEIIDHAINLKNMHETKKVIKKNGELIFQNEK